MTIQTFIEKAIAGGYKISLEWLYDGACDNDNGEVHICSVLLDPLAWQAVGKVEGWNLLCGKCGAYPCSTVYPHERGENRIWVKKMHRMIDALAEGKTITQFLESL